MERSKHIKTNSDVIIENYLKDSSDFSDMYLIGSKTEILDKLKKYVEAYPESKEQIENIVDNLDELIKSEFKYESFLKVLYNEEKHCKSVFGPYIFAHDLLKAEEYDGIELFRKRHMDKNEFESFINKIETRHPNQVVEIDYLRELYKKYTKTYIKDTGIDSMEATKLFLLKYNNDKKMEKMFDVFNSGYCIEEYCSHTGETVRSVEKLIDGITSENKKKFNTIYDETKNRDNTEFYKYIRFVVSKLLEIDKDDFTMMDYYAYTKLPVNDFRKIVEKICENTKEVRDLLLMIKVGNNSLPRISKVSQLSTKTIISGREITKEEKEKIFDYLEENNYPDDVYKIALRKYLNGTLFTGKTLGLKK